MPQTIVSRQSLIPNLHKISNSSLEKQEKHVVHSLVYAGQKEKKKRRRSPIPKSICDWITAYFQYPLVCFLWLKVPAKYYII